MNQGKEAHQAGLIKLTEGKTYEEFMAGFDDDELMYGQHGMRRAAGQRCVLCESCEILEAVQ